MNRLISTAVIAYLVLAAAASARSGETPDGGKREERLNRMREFVRSLSVVEVAGARKRMESRASAQLVLVYSDPARDTSDSALWIWTRHGRPVAATTLEFFPYRPSERQWSFEFASLSPNGVTMRRGATSQWRVDEAATVQRPFSAPPAAGKKRARRLREMRQLARRFRAMTVAGDAGRIELRLLPNPVYRYPEPKDGRTDGALFVFAYGTNPEVLLLLETVPADGRLEWRYGLAPLTASKVAASLDGAEIWTQPRFTGPRTRDIYTNGRFSTGVKR